MRVCTRVCRVRLPGSADMRAVRGETGMGRTWTAVGSTGAVDEESIFARRYAVDGPGLGYRHGISDTHPIVVRYNVTHTGEPDIAQQWNTLELGARAPGRSQVLATIFRVEPCSGDEQPFCRALVTGADRSICQFCDFNRGTIDFGKALYYIAVELSRSDPSLEPMVLTLRVYAR
jgi:hypothetical protein